MTTATTGLMTAEEFYDFVHRTENQGRYFELFRGKVVELLPPGERHGVLCGWVVYRLWQYVLKRGRGCVCSNGTGLLVEEVPGTVRGPDIMLLDESRPLRQLNLRYSTCVPLLVVEVLSPTDQHTRMNRWVSQYLKRGVPLVWWLDPEERCISIFHSGRELIVVDETEAITGEDVLPDLQFQVSDFFTLPGQCGRNTAEEDSPRICQGGGK